MRGCAYGRLYRNLALQSQLQDKSNSLRTIATGGARIACAIWQIRVLQTWRSRERGSTKSFFRITVTSSARPAESATRPVSDAGRRI
jgi:hypothetical protein